MNTVLYSPVRVLDCSQGDISPRGKRGRSEGIGIRHEADEKSRKDDFEAATNSI